MLFTGGRDQTLGDLVEIIKRSQKNIYAVLDTHGRFAGLVELNDIKQKIFQPELYASIHMRRLMKKPADLISIDEHMQKVMERFDISGSWYLPVVDRDRKFTGFISRSRLFQKYRELLMSEEKIYE